MVGAQPSPADLVKAIHTAKSDSLSMEAYVSLIRYYLINNIDSAKFYVDAGKKKFKESGYTKGIGKMMLQEGNYYQNTGNFSAALNSYTESLKLFNSISDGEYAGIVLNSIGTVESKSGNNDKALNSFLKALSIFEKLKNNKQISNTYLKMGVVFDKTENNDKALEYYKLAETYNKQAGNDPKGRGYILNNIGIIHGKKKDFKAAITSFEEGLQLADAEKSGELKAHLLLNAGIAHKHLNNIPVAVSYLLQARELAKKSHAPDTEIQALMNLAMIYPDQDPGKARQYLDEAFEINKVLAVNDIQYELLDVKIDIDRKLNDYKAAYSDLNAKDSIKYLMNDLEKSKEIAKLQTTFDLEKSREQVRLLELVNSKQTFYLKIIFAIAALLVLSLIATGLFYKKIARLNVNLHKQHKELIESNSTKDKLFSIIGHDLRGPVGNIPVMLNMMKDNTVTEEEKNYLLDEIYDYTYSLSGMLDKLLYWGQSQIRGARSNKTTFDGRHEIDAILVIERVASNKKNIVINDHTPAIIKLSGDVNMFSFIVRNLIGNARKFTHLNGQIDISADENSVAGFSVFCIKDNGIGITPEQQENLFKPSGIIERGTQQEKGTGLGLMLCKEFAVINGGDIWMKSEPGKGSEFYFSFPRA
jgi:signal transduction histidine kinase